jgi:uncharacterized membrane protein YkvA (DUF1232 family)
MENWFLKTSDYKNLSADITKRISNKNHAEKPDIFNISERLERLLTNDSFPNLFYIESLWICSQARKYEENDQIQSIVLAFLEELEKRIAQFNEVNFDDATILDKKATLNSFRIQNNSIVSIIVNHLKGCLENAKPCIKHCLTKSEVINVRKVLSKTLLSENDDLEKLLDGKQLETIANYNKYALFNKYEQSIYKIYDISESEDEKREIALACLKYILTKNDIISDSYGLLGLVDDLFAIDHTLAQLNQKNAIQTLVDIHDSNFPSFKLPELVSKQGVISTINLEQIVKASYTRKDDKKIKRLMIVPDIGPLSTLAALGHSICDRLAVKEKSQNLNNFIKGDYLLLGKYETTLQKKNVIVKLDEQSKDHPQLYYVYDRDGQRQTIQKRHLKNAFKVEQNRKLSRGKIISKYKNQSNPAIEGWSKIYFQENISKFRSKGPIYFFTTKYIADKFLKEKIYGNSIENILGIRSFDNKYKFNDNFSSKQLFPSPQLYIVADDDVAIELLNKRINGLEHRDPSLIIIDNEKFYKNSIFMEELSDINVDKTIFIEVYKDWHIKNLLESDFTCITAKPNKDLSTYSENFLPMHSPTAIYLERQSFFKVQFKVSQIKTLSDFLDLLGDIKTYMLDDNLYLFYRLISLKDSIRSQTVDRSEENILELEENIQKIIDDVAYLTEFNKFYMPLLNFLKKQREELVKINKVSELKYCLDENISKCNLIVVAGSQVGEVKNLLSASYKDSDVTVVNPLQLENISASKVDNVIVPSYISKSTMRRLRNYKYGKKHIYFGTKEEKELFEKYSNREKRIFDSNFRNSSEFIYLKKVIKEKDSALDTTATDLFKNLFNIANFEALKSSVSSEFVKAKMLGLDHNNILLIPENGKEYVVESNSVDIKTASMLNLEDEILINSEFSGEDLIKNLLRENEEDYSRYIDLSNKAKSWKTILKQYEFDNNLSTKDIQEELRRVGISRDLATIRNWLNSPYTLAPQKRNETIKKIYDLTGNNDEQKINECLDAIKLIRQLENAARNKLIDLLNKEDLTLSNIALDLNDLHIDFKKKTVNAITDIQVPTKYLYKVHDLDSFMQEFNHG